MYENKIITEPKWKSWIVQTTTPLIYTRSMQTDY
jgi:hypothetical protein